MAKRRQKGVAILRAYMELHQVTQQELADTLGVSKGLVWQWLTGMTAITPEKAKEIEKETGISRLRLLYPEDRALG